MKKECEKCGRALSVAGEAYICVHECTFCRDCSMSMNSICPNCGAEVPAKAKACPKCGADEHTGWSEKADAQRLGLPDDEFDYAIKTGVAVTTADLAHDLGRRRCKSGRFERLGRRHPGAGVRARSGRLRLRAGSNHGGRISRRASDYAPQRAPDASNALCRSLSLPRHGRKR